MTVNVLQRRFNSVLHSCRNIPSGSDAIRELAELGHKLEDAPVRKVDNVVARMTIVREDGRRTIVEVCDNASLKVFYHFFTQDGARRSTKRRVRTACRNEGLQPYFQAYRMQAGLEVLAERWKKMQGVKSVKVRIIKKKAYRKLIGTGEQPTVRTLSDALWSPLQVTVGRTA